MEQAVSVSKGQKFSIGKNTAYAAISLNKGNAEVDMSAFILYENGKVKSDGDFIFYNNDKSIDKSVELLSGGREIKIDLERVSESVSKIAVTLTIYDADKKTVTFSQLPSITVNFSSDGKQIAVYNIEKSNFTVETAIVVCEVYRYKDEWKFAAVGAGYRNGLAALCAAFGIETLEEPVTPLQTSHSEQTIKKEKPEKQRLPPTSQKELLRIADSILKVWESADLLMRQNNTLAYEALGENPEVFDITVFVSILYMAEKIKIERNLKSTLVKKLLSRSRCFSGIENIREYSMYELLEETFDKMSFLTIQNGGGKTDAASIYCYIICAVGQLLLKSAEELCKNDLEAYETIVKIIGNFDKTSVTDVMSIRTDITNITLLNNWYEEYASSSSCEDSLPELLKELNELVGLESVKKDVNSQLNIVKIQQARKERGLPIASLSLHLVFAGNPGTGKTTVARLLSKIYKAMGILEKGHLVEADRSKLVAGYVGQTAIKVREVVESAYGGVLFIDEAYSLTQKFDKDYGGEAIETLLKLMEDRRDDFIVIVAGYSDEMKEFILSNPGLQSRFNKYINFEDFSATQLFEIFKNMCTKSGLVLSSEAGEYAENFFNKHYNQKKNKDDFANARDVRNFYEKMLVTQANRLANIENPTDEELLYIKYEDVAEVESEFIKTEEPRRIGFI